jgi:hypothetical protein
VSTFSLRRKPSQQAESASFTMQRRPLAPPIVHEVVRSPGQPLDAANRVAFERRFGHDFSRVRVHGGERAAASAEAVDALAYTVGPHVVFGSGYGPSRHGESGRLLAHELVHVVQWGDHPIPTQLPIGAADGAAERQAQAGDVGSHASTSSLQRAVRVCEEYRAQDSASATPGPGISVSVSRSGQRANVNAALQVHGAEADAAKASAIQNTIAANWNGSFPDGYRINTNVRATFREKGQSEAGNASQIELVRSGGSPSHVNREWVVGSRYMTLNLDESNALGWGAAHEFGHLLALDDRYDESLWSEISGLFGGERSSSPQAGYENNIMAVDGGSLESVNVQNLIVRHLPDLCVRWRTESPI